MGTNDRRTWTDSVRGVPGVVVALGFVSLLSDVSSGIAHSLFPLLIVSNLGLGVGFLGLVEGAAKALPLAVRGLSGRWSDRLRDRRPLLVSGYALAAASRVLLALAPSPAWAIGARWSDRVGKGLRGAPRDALIADVTPPGLLGTAYGLRHSLDLLGALIGPLLAVLLLQWTAGELRPVFWFSCVPAFAALVLLVRAIRGVPPPPAAPSPSDSPREDVANPGARWLLLLGFALAFAQFSDAFLILRAKDMGMATEWVPTTVVVVRALSFLAVLPAGLLSDRVGRLGLLAFGVVVLVAADLVLALAGAPGWALFGAALWGVHVGLTQGIVPALLAESADTSQRGWTFGRYSLVQGVAALATNALAGFLWTRIGPSAVFLAAAGVSVLALLLLVPLARSRRN